MDNKCLEPRTIVIGSGCVYGTLIILIIVALALGTLLIAQWWVVVAAELC